MPARTGVTRRRLIASAVAAPTIIAASALGRAQAPAPSDRLCVGFIGVGKQGRGHVENLAGRKGVQVVAVCDVDTNRREDAVRRVDRKYAELERKNAGGCASYVDYRELLARRDVDAVLISTPDHWHAAQAIDACKAGKDVYCEKPLTLTIREAQRLIEAVRKYDRVFQVGSQQRSSAEFRKAVEYVRNGRIGQLLTVHVGVSDSSVPCDLPAETPEPGLDWDRWLGGAPQRPYHSVLSPRGVHDHFPAWRDYREYSGGAMTDMGAHHFDIAQWGLDADASGPVAVLPPRDERSKRGVRFEYANGVHVVHGGNSGVTFIGNDGTIYVDRGRLESWPESILKQPLTASDSRVYESNDHHQDWLDCVKSRRRPICDVEVGARSVTVCHLGNLVYWNRRPLKWDPKGWEFPGDAEANRWLDRSRRDGYALPEV